MWVVFGMWYIFAQPGIMHIQHLQEFDTPQNCFAQAMEVMTDNSEETHMACVPRFMPKAEGGA